MNLSPGTIAAVIDHMSATTPQTAMSEHQLVLTGYHQALADACSALRRAAELADDDGTLPDYIDLDSVVGARGTP